MPKEYITIHFQEFEELKNHVKFIEFYWMKYKSQNQKKDYTQEIKQQVDAIEFFIHKKEYDELRKVKLSFRGTKVTLSKINYLKLENYVKLSLLLQNTIKYTNNAENL